MIRYTPSLLEDESAYEPIMFANLVRAKTVIYIYPLVFDGI